MIAAMAYQAGLNPPSGVWQEDRRDDTGNICQAGTSIMASKYPDGYYPKFMTYNSISFVAYLSIVLLLISGLPMKKRIFMWVTITFMTLTYVISLKAVSPDHEPHVIHRVLWIRCWYGWCDCLCYIGSYYPLPQMVCRESERL